MKPSGAKGSVLSSKHYIAASELGNPEVVAGRTVLHGTNTAGAAV